MLQRQTPTQIPIRFGVHFVGVCVGLCLVVGQCKCTINAEGDLELNY